MGSNNHGSRARQSKANSILPGSPLNRHSFGTTAHRCRCAILAVDCEQHERRQFLGLPRSLPERHHATPAQGRIAALVSPKVLLLNLVLALTSAPPTEREKCESQFPSSQPRRVRKASCVILNPIDHDRWSSSMGPRAPGGGHPSALASHHSARGRGCGRYQVS